MLLLRTHNFFQMIKYYLHNPEQLLFVHPSVINNSTCFCQPISMRQSILITINLSIFFSIISKTHKVNFIQDGKIKSYLIFRAVI